MKINEAYDVFSSLKNKSNNKTEIKVYNNFLIVLRGLQVMNLSSDKEELIEEFLDSIDLNNEEIKSRKYYKKKLNEFNAFLKKKFSFVYEGYYNAISVALGISFGSAIGAIFTNSVGISYGIFAGLFVGIVVGSFLDNRAEKQNRVLRKSKGK